MTGKLLENGLNMTGNGWRTIANLERTECWAFCWGVKKIEYWVILGDMPWNLPDIIGMLNFRGKLWKLLV